jgi:hypothetical protein
MIKTACLKNSKGWTPHKDFDASNKEIAYVLHVTKQLCGNKLHKYFKTVESCLLSTFRDMMNNIHEHHKLQELDYILTTQKQWRLLALLRDFHDYMCGRDIKHYIRTDDCRRFVVGVSKGLKSNKFIKPVYRLLDGENAPRNFTHPLFIIFN